MTAMNVIIVGSGRVGAGLAYSMFNKGHKVTVVDQLDANFDNLPPDFRGRTLALDVLNRDVLRQIGIEECDALAAVSNDDAVNVVVAHVARTVYNVPTVVVRNYDPQWRPILEAFGVQIVSPSSWAAQRIEELLYQSEVRAVFSAGNGEVEVYEFRIPAGWAGKQVRDLFPEEQCRVVAVTRAGRAVLPACDFEMQEGDLVYLTATIEGLEVLRRWLKDSPLIASGEKK
jgi:trk system potassium uptake protein TrkA